MKSFRLEEFVIINTKDFIINLSSIVLKVIHLRPQTAIKYMKQVNNNRFISSDLIFPEISLENHEKKVMKQLFYSKLFKIIIIF